MFVYVNLPIILVKEKANKIYKAAMRINAYHVSYLITFHIKLAGPEFAEKLE